MRKRPGKLLRISGFAVVCMAGVLAVVAIGSPHATRVPQAAAPGDDAALLDGFRHVEVASVSDASEQVLGRKMYMTHRMRPIFPTKFAGYAVTVLLKKENNNDVLEKKRKLFQVFIGRRRKKEELRTKNESTS